MMMPPPPVPSGPVHGVAWVDALEAEKKELQEKENKLEAEKKKLQEKEDKLQKLLVKVGKARKTGALADIKDEVNEVGIFDVEDAFCELQSKLAEVQQEKANVIDQLKATQNIMADVTAILVQVATESAYEAKRKASLADMQATLAKRTKVSSSGRHHTQSEMWERQGEVHRVEPAFVYEGDWAGGGTVSKLLAVRRTVRKSCRPPSPRDYASWRRSFTGRTHTRVLCVTDGSLISRVWLEKQRRPSTPLLPSSS